MGGLVSKKTYEVNKGRKGANQNTEAPPPPNKRALVSSDLPKPNVSSISEENEDPADAEQIENKMRESVVRQQYISAAELSNAEGNKDNSADEANIKDETQDTVKIELRLSEKGNSDDSSDKLVNEPAVQISNVAAEQAEINIASPEVSTTIPANNNKSNKTEKTDDNENETVTSNDKDKQEKDTSKVTPLDEGSTKFIKVLSEENHSGKNIEKEMSHVHIDNASSKEEKEILETKKEENKINEQPTPHIEDPVQEQKNEDKPAAEAHSNSENIDQSHVQVEKLSENHIEPHATKEATRSVLDSISEVEKEVKNLSAQINMPACDKDTIMQELIKCMIKLDNLLVENDEQRAERKRVIKSAQEAIAILEKKSGGSDKKESEDDSSDEDVKRVK